MEELGDILKRLATGSISEGSAENHDEAVAEDGEPCPRCGGRGWFTQDVPVGHPDFGKAVTCDCQHDRLASEQTGRLLRYSNLGALARFRFESLDPEGRSKDPASKAGFTAAFDAAVSYAEAPRDWLVFVGPHGSGKTHLAAAIGNRRIEKGHAVFFVNVPDLLDHLRASFGPSSEISYSELFEQVKNAPLLILDGLGSHSTTPWAEEKLRQVFNHRFNAGLPTIATVAPDLDDVDPYLLGRLRSPDLSTVVEVGRRLPEGIAQWRGIEPLMLERMTLETFDVRGNNPRADQRASLEAAYQAAKNFAVDPHGWLTLFGGTGAGKTHLAVAIAGEQLKKGQPVFFAFVPKLLDYLRYTYSPDSRVTYDRLFDEVMNTELLVLDDLGKERSNPWAVEKLYQIIVHRHNARLPTVVTSMMEFDDELDPITSRVQDPWVGQLIRMDAPDYRNKRRRQ